MADRILYRDFLRRTSIREQDLHGVANRAFLGIEIVPTKLRILFDLHFGPQLVDKRIFCDFVFVILSGQVAPEERHGNHVLNAMITVRRIANWTNLIDDAFCRFLGLDDDPTDLVQPVSDSRVKLDRGFYRSLSMKFCRKGNLEKDVSHDVRAERLSERDWLSSLNDVLKTPLFCR